MIDNKEENQQLVYNYNIIEAVKKLKTFDDIQKAIDDNQRRYIDITKRLEKNPNAIIECQNELQELEE